MRAFTVIVLLTCCSLYAAETPNESKQLLIPLSPPAEEKPSEAMEVLVASMHRDRVLTHLQSWERLAELPDWVFEPAHREIAYVFDPPAMNDGFRFAIIAGTKGELIVIKAGGIGGVYEIYNRPPEPKSLGADDAA